VIGYMHQQAIDDLPESGSEIVVSRAHDDYIVPVYTQDELYRSVRAARQIAIEQERERWLKAAAAALEILDELPTWQNVGHACKLLRECVGPNVELTGRTRSG